MDVLNNLKSLINHCVQKNCYISVVGVITVSVFRTKYIFITAVNQRKLLIHSIIIKYLTKFSVLFFDIPFPSR